jgi:hypothetical protein
VYILPYRDECLEAFQWLAQEVQHAKGEALIIHVEQFEGLTDAQIVETFRAARQQEYVEIGDRAQELEQTVRQVQSAQQNLKEIREAIAKLRKRYSETVRIDFFDCPASTQVAAQLLRIEQALASNPPNSDHPLPAALTDYQTKRWVTRPRPFIDRIACAWLIRRFINPGAAIRYSLDPEPDEVAFDMKEAEFGHRGNLCSFETMLQRFELDRPGLQAIAQMVHELDLRDGQYICPEAEGIERIVRGWLLMGLADAELEARGIALFDGLQMALSRQKPSA